MGKYLRRKQWIWRTAKSFDGEFTKWDVLDKMRNEYPKSAPMLHVIARALGKCPYIEKVKVKTVMERGYPRTVSFYRRV